MKFQNIPQFTVARYSVDVPWGFLLDWEKSHKGSGLNLDPDFQRAHVWTPEKQIAYVEYILKGGVSGRDIYFNHPGWFRGFDGSMDIVDGKQRWQAAKLFLSDGIPAFGYYFSQYEDNFPWEASFKVHVNDLKTRAEVLRWYLDLNEGGVTHTSEELDKVRALLAKEEVQ